LELQNISERLCLVLDNCSSTRCAVQDMRQHKRLWRPKGRYVGGCPCGKSRPPQVLVVVMSEDDSTFLPRAVCNRVHLFVFGRPADAKYSLSDQVASNPSQLRRRRNVIRSSEVPTTLIHHFEVVFQLNLHVFLSPWSRETRVADTSLARNFHHREMFR